MGSFRENVAALESSHDTKQFSTEAAEFRRGFLRDVEEAQEALSRAPEIVREDPTIPVALKVLKVTLPSQLDTRFSSPMREIGLRFVSASKHKFSNWLILAPRSWPTSTGRHSRNGAKQSKMLRVCRSVFL